MLIKHNKKQYFGDEYSDEPYILFFEEADTLGDVMSRKPGKYLEELKN